MPFQFKKQSLLAYFFWLEESLKNVLQIFFSLLILNIQFSTSVNLHLKDCYFDTKNNKYCPINSILKSFDKENIRFQAVELIIH